ncbi:hypothetical protein Poly24_22910 [Rosistilla carotiformis]|uniref:Uncharacterized protein n=1 Tax=Rosistilla carotiformis TaxID=2528017 RepID=A0A518JSR0_9BACT|nr:hypothetical protein [Rosistilla carotiformis]QDV68581.1 hypothetical protein Poly24_22910 [Rosistilla carotiformis]
MLESAVLSNGSATNVEMPNQELIQALASADAPVTVAELCRAFSAQDQRDPQAIQQQLDRLVQQQAIHRFAPYRGKADRFWDRSLDHYATRVITSEAEKQIGTKSDLSSRCRARLKDMNVKQLGDFINQLATVGQLHVGRFLGSQALRYSARPIGPQAMLENAIAQIAKRCSISPDAVRASILPPEPSAPRSTSPTETDLSDAALVMETIAQMSTSPSPAGVIVSIAELRRAMEFKLAGPSFDAAIRQLEDEAQIDLTTHPDPGALSAAEREARMLRGDGKVYDMLVVRR